MSENIPEKYLSPYDPKATEEEIYKHWEENGYFNPDVCVEKGICESDAETFSMVLPPPNVTGTLHTGHSMMIAVEDLMVRFNRMLGKRTLWIPGTDHAAIATQSKVEKDLSKEGIKKHDLGREEFLRKVEEFAQNSHDTIVSQVKRLGASLDWSREAYTLDEQREIAVREAFKRMYEAGLIYRGDRVINWDPKGQTTISDDEIVYVPQKGKLYTFKYSADFPIPIATTRPETKVGDVAVAVHPDDSRYAQYIGKTFENIEFAGEKISIKVVGDEVVDPEYGTGAVGVTPAHSFTDSEIAKRHSLPTKKIINEYGKMSVEGPLEGFKASEAREKVVEWLEENNLLEKTEEIEQNLATAERTGGVIEPLPKVQWFIDVNKEFSLPYSDIKGIEAGQKTTLKEIMRKAVQSDQIQILPDRFEKTYYHWIENLHDWCISRQIWFGHRVPVWYKGEEIYVGVNAPEGEEWQQDEDTLDTWFSSGLWTFSTLGWPEETDDLKNYHPTDVLETGYDILFFWIARMVLMTGFLLGDVPFRTVYLHGLVRDSQGRKMSKSLGNIVDPVDLIEKYGADALRMALVVGVGAGNDSNLGEEKVKAYKLFSNKIWNISRFVLSNLPENFDGTHQPNLSQKHRENIEALDKFAKEITEDIKKYNFHLASEKMYHYIWHDFADIIIEEAKTVLAEGTEEEKASIQWTLVHILRTSLKLLHPFMPFITEEIWKDLKEGEEERDLIVEKWPTN